jgi:threonyl-tRNA synthetase
MAQVLVLSPDGSANKVDRDSQEALQALRQTTALLLKAALKQEFPGIRLGDGAATDDGFYVDSDKDDAQVSADQLEGLAAAIKKFAKDDAKIELATVPLDDALAQASDDQFSNALIKAAAQDGQVAVYKVGDVIAVANNAILPYANVLKNYELLVSSRCILGR